MLNSSVNNMLNNTYNNNNLNNTFYNSSSNMNMSNSTVYTTKEKADPFEEAKYLLCKHKTLNQYFTFRFHNFEELTKEEDKVYLEYCKLYDIYINLSNNNPNNFFHMEKNEEYTNIIYTNETYIIFGSFSLFKEVDEVSNLIQSILKSIKSKEAYFYIN